MIKLFSFFIFIWINFSIAGQSINAKRYIKTDSFKCEFFVSNKSIRDFFIHDSLVYYWCKSQKLLATQGGFSGKLIDGKFSKFYNSGQLAEQGRFRMGLRHGEWKVWHANGVLKKVCKYHYGKIKGRLVVFNQYGKMVKQEKYRNGKLKLKRQKNNIIEEEVLEDEKEKIQLRERIRLFIESKKSNEVSGVVHSKDKVKS